MAELSFWLFYWGKIILLDGYFFFNLPGEINRYFPYAMVTKSLLESTIVLTTTTFLEQSFLGNTLLDYSVAIAFLVGGLILIAGLREVVSGYLRRWAKNTQFQLDQRLIKFSSISITRIFYVGNIALAVGNLTLHPILNEAVRAFVVIATTGIIIQFLSQFINYGFSSYLLKKGDIELEQSFSALMPIVRTILWAVGAVFLLDNLGFDISAVVTSLGIGGLAIAFAAQGILGDLFSYFSIILDRPFTLGDFIIVGDYVGTVKHIGIKTTRLTSITGEEIVIANTDLTNSRIRNYKTMERRRITFKIGILYETSQEKLEVIPVIIKEIINSQEQVTFDRAHFLSYSDFSLDYETVYYVESSDYNLYMDIQQKINLALFKAFIEREIEFAYPTNLTYLQSAEIEEKIISAKNNKPNQ